MNQYRPLLVFVCLLCMPLASSGLRAANQDDAQHDHSAHQQMLDKKDYTKELVDYVVPGIYLIDQRGKQVQLRKLLAADMPTFVQFIFTTCTTICPVLSASFAAAQNDLNNVGVDYQMVSITIDPEHDTPAVLREYAKRFRAQDQWYFLTGTMEDIAAVQKAFGASYKGNNKMYHQPVTYLRAQPDQPWLKLEGLLSSAELKAEYLASLRDARLAAGELQ